MVCRVSAYYVDPLETRGVWTGALCAVLCQVERVLSLVRGHCLNFCRALLDAMPCCIVCQVIYAEYHIVLLEAVYS